MMKLFYKIWVDAIAFEKARPSSNGKWKGFTMAYMTVLVSVNIGTLYGILYAFGLNIGKPIMQYLSFLRVEDLRNLIMGIIIMLFPAFLINYSLIFYNKKYERLILNYENKGAKKGKLLMIYFVASFLILNCVGILNRLLHTT